jgi:hypothetical protein
MNILTTVLNETMSGKEWSLTGTLVNANNCAYSLTSVRTVQAVAIGMR